MWTNFNNSFNAVFLDKLQKKMVLNLLLLLGRPFTVVTGGLIKCS